MNELHSHPCRDCGKATNCDGILDSEGVCSEFDSGRGSFFCTPCEDNRDAAWQKDLDRAMLMTHSTRAIIARLTDAEPVSPTQPASLPNDHPAVIARLTDAEPLVCAWCVDYRHPADVPVSHGICPVCIDKMELQSQARLKS